MYKNIEILYKKKSPYNTIKKKTFIIYLFLIIISLFFKILNNVIAMIIVFLIMLFLMLKTFEKELNVKLYLSFHKKNNNDKSLSNLIKDREHILFKNYLIHYKLYNEKTLLCIIEHYRALIKIKIVSGNLLAILSIVIPILLAFYTKEGFDFEALAIAIPYIFCLVIIIAIMFFCYNQIIEIKKFFKGEDGMVERLEEIFSELYVECISETNYNNVANVNKRKKVSKKRRK